VSFRELQAAAFYDGPLGTGMEREIVYLPRDGSSRTMAAVVEFGMTAAETERTSDLVETCVITVGRVESHAKGGVAAIAWGDGWRLEDGERIFTLVEVIEETPVRYRLRGEHRRVRTVQKRA